MRWAATTVAVCLVFASCGVRVEQPGGGAPATVDVEPAPKPTTSPSDQPSATVDAPDDTSPPPPTAPTTASEPAGPSTTTAVADPEPRPTVLRRGDEGDWVLRLQEELRRHGYTIEADGIFGPATERAVRGFQYAHDLEVDGLAGPNTWHALEHGPILPVAEAPVAVTTLRAGGLGDLDFGAPADTVVDALVAVLGTPTEDHNWWGGDDGRRTTSWRGPGGAEFVVVSTSAGGGLRFVGWELNGWFGLDGFDLATSAGVTLGTEAADLAALHPETRFGFYPEPGCGDAWWSPGEFAVGGSGEVVRFGELRGSLDLADTYGPLERAVIAHGFPDGLHCFNDVMCTEVIAELQAALGVPVTSFMDRTTWTALGLPLPLEPDAPVALLRAGETIPQC